MMDFGHMMDGNYKLFWNIEIKLLYAFSEKILILICLDVFCRNNLNYITEEIQNPRRYVWKER